MRDGWGFPRLGKVFYDLSIDEMKDADSLIQRILMFDGHPNASAAECRSLGDHGTASIFDAMVREEEEHADWFEAQLPAIEAVGLQSHLAQQIDMNAAPR